MQFTLSSGTLNARLQTLVRVIGGKNAISILDCFLFEVANNTLTVTASDNENVMQSTKLQQKFFYLGLGECDAGHYRT